jgi:hypothetical protein
MNAQQGCLRQLMGQETAVPPRMEAIDVEGRIQCSDRQQPSRGPGMDKGLPR